MSSTARLLPTTAVLCCALAAACGAASTDPAADVGLEVLPAAPQLLPSGQVTFTATAAGTTVAVLWSVQEGPPGGAITAGGAYTAPGSTGVFHVVATSVASPDVSATATVTVTPAPVVQVTVTPRAPSVTAGGTLTFTATVTGTATTGVTWTVQEGAPCGSVSSGGVYTAPATAGTCHVVATSQADGTKSDTATVTVTPVPPVVTVAVAPHAPSVTVGGAIAFSATVTGTGNPGVTWTIQEGAAGGSITSTGAYTAPATPGTYHVVATSVVDTARSDTATVTVNPAPPVIAVAVAPRTPSVTAGGTLTFTATVTGTATTGVTWTVQEGAPCGSITSGGVYTAPGAAGTCHVVATSQADGTKSDTATVTVTAVPSVVTVAVAPHAPSVTVGGAIAFSATVTGTGNPGVTWTIQEGTAGGSITSTGAYTAPGTPGTYHVVATSVVDTARSDTATVTVTPAPVIAVAVAPRTPSVAAGGTLTFTATVTGTATTTVTWSVTEASGCGSVTAAGVYTAPAAAATCHVRATSVADGTKSDTATVTVTAPPAGLAAQLAVLAGKAIYFGHRSVGLDIMTGVRHLVDQNAGAEPTVVQTSSAASMGPGIWAEALNGTNFYPTTKIDAFQASIQGGVGAKVGIAFFKFCWVDFNVDSDWYATGGTSAGLFARYQTAMTSLKAAYPGVTFVHFTSPLFAVGFDSEQYARNVQREQYNALIRATYGGLEPVFDLALLESTDPSGNRVIGASGPALYAGYTYDGGHLNAAAQDRFATALIAFLAALP